MKPALLLFFVALTVTPALGQTDFRDFRTWTSKSGEFSVEARYVKSDSETVMLRRKDNGKTKTVALNDLAKPDILFVRKAASIMADRKESTARRRLAFEGIGQPPHQSLEKNRRANEAKLKELLAKEKSSSKFSSGGDGRWLYFDRRGQHGGYIVNGKYGPYWRTYPNGTTRDLSLIHI